MLMPYRIALALLLLIDVGAHAQDNNAPGRYLPDGHYLARNMQADS
jgi:hypothetical protein